MQVVSWQEQDFPWWREERDISGRENSKSRTAVKPPVDGSREEPSLLESEPGEIDDLHPALGYDLIGYTGPDLGQHSYERPPRKTRVLQGLMLVIH